MRRDNAKRSVAPAEKRDAAILSTPSRHTSEGGALVSDPVEAYFTQLRDIRSAGAGVVEISYYGPLAALLDAVGAHLKPKAHALMQLRNTGSGNPDGGLFTASQLKGWETGTDPLQGQLPTRGPRRRVTSPRWCAALLLSCLCSPNSTQTTSA